MRVLLPYLALLPHPLVLSSLAAVGVGLIPSIGQEFSVSRTVALLPFFLLGWLIKQRGLDRSVWFRAPSLLHDYHLLEKAIGGHPPAAVPARADRLRGWLYRFALERGYLDALLARYVVGPFLRLFRWCDAAERRWTNFLTPGGASRESDLRKPYSGGLEDLP